MRFLTLLLPNIYDIFTAIAIIYAFFVDKETPLKIPFLYACIAIYIATRLGIFAGQIIGMLNGQGMEEETADVNDPDAFTRKLMWGFVPQLIGVIIFQIIVAFCYLPNFGGNQNLTNQEQVQLYDNNKDTAASQNTAYVEPKQQQEELVVQQEAKNEEIAEGAEEEIVPVSAPAPQPTVKRTYTTSYKKSYVAKAKPAAEKPQEATTATVNTVRYDIPERTLRVAGISPSEIQLANVTNNTQAATATTNNNTWSFSATNNTVPQTTAQTANVATSSSSSLQPKRYPGDDNPINTSWGYYRTGKWAADAERTLKNK